MSCAVGGSRKRKLSPDRFSVAEAGRLAAARLPELCGACLKRRARVARVLEAQKSGQPARLPEPAETELVFVPAALGRERHAGRDIKKAVGGG